MDVHHISPFRVSCSNDLSNLVLLCDPCHHAVERRALALPHVLSGLPLGLKNIATDSDAETFSGAHIANLRAWHH